MKTLKFLTVLATLSLCASACTPPPRTGLFSGKPVAGRVKTADGSRMVVADITRFRDSIFLPVSELVENLEIIPLDSSDEALFGYGNITVSDNYIGVFTLPQPVTFKLFDRKGKYLRDIGHEGRGPGEYGPLGIYSAAIDEPTQTIYILPWNATELLAFGIDGTYMEPVKLAYNAPKGVFNVNPDGTFSFAVLPIGNAPVWAWTQDRNGVVINEVANPDPDRYLEYSSEIAAGGNAGGFDPFLSIYTNKSSDTLSVYDVAAGRMRPLFTMGNIQSRAPVWYGYGQLPGYFVGNYTPDIVDGRGLPPINFIVDKQTLLGAYYILVIDQLGGLRVQWPNDKFTQGHFIDNIPAITLKRRLERHIASGVVKDPVVLERIRDLNDSLTEEDNNVVFVGRLKTI